MSSITGRNLKFRYLVLISLCFFINGCASFAHSPYACDSATERLFFYSWLYKLIGNVTQLGDCAASKTLKIELGDYYRQFKSTIDYEVEMKFTEKEGYGLNNFAMAFNCKTEAFPKFHTEVIQNKDDIFGPNFDRSPREVTKSVQKLIANDQELSKLCQ